MTPIGFAGHHLVAIRDKHQGADRFLFRFDDDTGVVVSEDGQTSRWIEDDALDAWNDGRDLDWAEVPPAVAATASRRCDQLHDILVHDRWPDTAA